MSPDLAIAWLLFSTVLIGIMIVFGIFRYRRGLWYRKLSLKVQAYLLWGIGAVALISTLYPFFFLYAEHLWSFEGVGYPDVFWKILKIRWGLFFGFFLVAFLFMNLNAVIAKRLCPETREFSRWTRDRTISFHRTFFCGTILLAILFAIPMMSLHDEYFLYMGQPKETKITLVDSEKIDSEIPDSKKNEGDITETAKPDANVIDIKVNQKSSQETLFFGKDEQFYIFSYPLHKAISLWTQILFLVTCGMVGLLYNFYYRRDARSMGFVKRNIVLHGSILWLLLLAVEIWRSHVYLWGKVYTKSATPTLNKLYGLFYMDAQLADSTFIYCAIVFGLSVLVIINLFWRRRPLWYAAIVIWCIAYILLIQVYPRFIHFVNVQSDDLLPESKYLQTHIKSTRKAFDLQEIIRRNYSAGEVTLEEINNDSNKEVLENVQLWDRRVLYDILRAEHLVRHHNYHPYTDIDRYKITVTPKDNNNDSSEEIEIEKQYRQVLVAAREIQPDPEVQGERGNWRNRKLAFTHGYGVYVAPVNEIDEKKSPVFWSEVKLNTKKFKNEAVATFPELKVTQPRIYYGELTDDYVIVNTTVPEYDFESEVTLTSTDEQEDASDIEENDEYHYQGEGGVQLTGWFRRLCFAVRFLDLQILYNKYTVLLPDSRIMFWRKIGTRQGKKVIADRISRIAPFLEYDPDPYIVIDDGQLWWIVDYYVTSRWYPNAQFYEDDTAEVPTNLQEAERRYKEFNYIRNPGVAIVNAYTGEVNFYAVKQNEILMDSYNKSFPNLFKGFDEMPPGLRTHLRFPDYLTRIQANVYKEYHVTNARDFYQKGLQLMIPEEVYGIGNKTKDGGLKWKDDQEMMPYYAMIRMPGEEDLEFVNMIPFTPYQKEFDMKAWFVVRCDAPHYGERIVYTLNNTPDVKGPKHVEDLITSELSEDFLKLQSGNVVMRGGLYFIPLKEGIIYVEAIYQKPDTAEETEKKENERPKRPILKAVVTAANDNVATDPNFSESVRKAVEVGLKNVETSTVDIVTNEEEEPTALDRLEVLAQALDDLRKTLQAEQNGNGQKAVPKNTGNKKKTN